MVEPSYTPKPRSSPYEGWSWSFFERGIVNHIIKTPSRQLSQIRAGKKQWFTSVYPVTLDLSVTNISVPTRPSKECFTRANLIHHSVWQWTVDSAIVARQIGSITTNRTCDIFLKHSFYLTVRCQRPSKGKQCNWDYLLFQNRVSESNIYLVVIAMSTTFFFTIPLCMCTKTHPQQRGQQTKRKVVTD